MAQPRRKKSTDVRLLLLLATAFAVPVLSHFIKEGFSGVKALELQVYDWRTRELVKPPYAPKPDTNLVIVGMDDPSCDHLFKTGLIDRPVYTRAMQARMLRDLRSAGAKTVAFDVFFTSDAPVGETQAFSDALRECGGAIVALKPEDIPGPVSDTTKLHFIEPVPEIRKYARAGSIAFPATEGHVVRWFDPYAVDSATFDRHLHLTVMAVTDFRNEAQAEPMIEKHVFRMGSIDAPWADEFWHIGIRYVGPPSTFVPDADQMNSKPPVNYISYQDVYTGKWREKDPSLFRGKLVLVGRISPIEDRVLTPQGNMQGVELLANTIQTLLQRNWIGRWNVGTYYTVMLALCLLVSLTVWRFNLAWAGGAAAAVSVGWFFLSWVLFARGIWAEVVDPILAVILTFAMASAIDAWKTRGVFMRFVPVQVAEDILRAPDGATTEREVAIAFCDIRNYTVLSELLSPEQSENLLHTYFREGEAAADRFGGVLDKFVGDEMMLYFEARRGRESHVLRAVRWALAMQEKAGRIEAGGEAGETGFRIGIGIAAGPVRFGRVKARQRLQHTVIGDAVNLASRLQSATKELNVPILLSGAAYDAAADRITAERLADISVKGKQDPQAIYHPTAVRE